jgi:hypothetical protein
MYYISRLMGIGLILWAGYMAYGVATTTMENAVAKQKAAMELALKEATGND